jgi:hypothetical protein
MQARTRIKQELILKQLGINGGDVKNACRNCKIGRTQFYEWMKTDSGFKNQIENVYRGFALLSSTSLYERVKSNDIKAIEVFCRMNLKKLK